MHPRVRPEHEAASIVLRGSFNPSIFHPAWLAAKDLIAEEATQDSEIAAIADQVSVFRVEWLRLSVTPDRFQAGTDDPSHYLSLAELVRGIFSLLEFTPVQQMGLNRQMHIPTRGEDEWHRLGDSWAPKEAWLEVLPGRRPDDLPGVRSLTMEGLRRGSSSEFVRVTVEPSTKVPSGIYVYTNEHFEQEESDSVGRLMQVLETDWSAAQDFALQVANHLLKGSR